MTESRVLAVDYGKKRIGLAVTDPLNIFAYPLATLLNDSKFWQGFLKIIFEYNVKKLILGFPLREGGEDSHVTKDVLAFRDELIKKTGLPVELVDERYSSEIAKQRIIETVGSRKKRRDKSLVDKNAAAVILEDFLNSSPGKS